MTNPAVGALETSAPPEMATRRCVRRAAPHRHEVRKTQSLGEQVQFIVTQIIEWVLRRFARRTDVAENVLGMSSELMSSVVTFDVPRTSLFIFGWDLFCDFLACV